MSRPLTPLNRGMFLSKAKNRCAALRLRIFQMNMSISMNVRVYLCACANKLIHNLWQLTAVSCWLAKKNCLLLAVNLFCCLQKLTVIIEVYICVHVCICTPNEWVYLRLWLVRISQPLGGQRCQSVCEEQPECWRRHYCYRRTQAHVCVCVCVRVCVHMFELCEFNVGTCSRWTAETITLLFGCSSLTIV